MTHNRDYSTSQGFHLNALAKKWVSNELADSIRLLCVTSNKTPSFHLPWKREEQESLSKNEDTVTNKVLGNELQRKDEECGHPRDIGDIR
jgi:hypothetical protein